MARTKVSEDRDYLELLTQKIFISGFSMKGVESKWPAFQRAFLGFEPEKVAGFIEEDIDKLCKDPSIIRNGRKIAATIQNAQTFLQVREEYGSFHQFLRSLDGVEYSQKVKLLGKRLRMAGPNTLYYFLLESGEEVPEETPPGVTG